MQKVDFENLVPNQGPVPGSLLTPSLMSRRKLASCSSFPGFASRWMKNALRPGVLSTPVKTNVGLESEVSDHEVFGLGKGES